MIVISLSLGASVLGGSFFPSASPSLLSKATRNTQFFTLYAQAWAVGAWITEHPAAISVALVTEAMVFCLYHGVTAYKPTLLSYGDREMVYSVTRWAPPRFALHALIWLGLHIQHTFSPAYVWYTFFPTREKGHEAYVLAALAGYDLWNSFCWYVNGKPAYPIQTALKDKGVLGYARLVFYAFGIFIALFVC